MSYFILEQEGKMNGRGVVGGGWGWQRGRDNEVVQENCIAIGTRINHPLAMTTLTKLDLQHSLFLLCTQPPLPILR